MPESRFANKVLLATGGASGLAAAVARRFTDEGGRVAVVDLDAERAQTGRRQARRRDRPRLRRRGRGRRHRRRPAGAQEQLGRIDCVFNAAGHAEFGPVEEWSLARWNRMMTVHAGGHVPRLPRGAGRHDARGGGGSIVNVASVAALAAQSGNAPYGAAKGAILAFSRQLAKRGRARRSGSTSIAPGRTRTGMTEPLMIERGRQRRGGRAGVRAGQPAEARRRAGGDRGAGLLPALGRRQLHHRRAARRRRRRDRRSDRAGALPTSC